MPSTSTLLLEREAGVVARVEAAGAVGVAGVELPAGVEVAVPIWTTTPWTLPASLAVSLGADIRYVLAEGPAHNGKRRWLVLAAALAERALQRYGVENVVLHGETTGAALENQLLAHPFYPKREILVLNGDHVSDEDGTGAVHTAPGHGQEDYVVSKQYGLLDKYNAGQINPGHVLVATRRQVETVMELDEVDAAHLFAVATRIAKAVQAEFRPTGMTLLQTNKPAGWQTVPHVHVHVLPRYANDGAELVWPRKDPPLAELQALAARIKV